MTARDHGPTKSRGRQPAWSSRGKSGAPLRAVVPNLGINQRLGTGTSLEPLSVRKPVRLMKVVHMAREFLEGNEAIARGCMKAKCDFFAGYPITPASSILHYMLELVPAIGGTDDQSSESAR